MYTQTRNSSLYALVKKHSPALSESIWDEGEGGWAPGAREEGYEARENRRSGSQRVKAGE